MKNRRSVALVCVAAGGLLLAGRAWPSSVQGGAAGGQPGASAKRVWSKDFRPSGNGQPLPLPAIVDGRPVGLWWYPYVSTIGVMVGAAGFDAQVFLPDGTFAALFRPGGPRAVDIDGMRAAGEQDSIGRYSVSGGVMTIVGSSRTSRPISAPIRVEPFLGSHVFDWADRHYQPALAVRREDLIGHWSNGSVGGITWRADGSVSAARHFFDDGLRSGSDMIEGRWALDGYLLAFRFPGLGDRFLTAFRPLKGGLAFDGFFWTKTSS